jgi:hypothetical protein
VTHVGRAARRASRRVRALVPALAALAAAACAAGGRQPRATEASLRRLASAVRHDVHHRPVALAPLLAGRVVLYFFRSDCAHCAADVVAAPGLAARPGAPPLVLVSREGPARLRMALGPEPRPGLVVVSDSDGAIMGSALPTRFVPRVVAVERFTVRRDVTGERGGLAGAMAALSEAQ